MQRRWRFEKYKGDDKGGGIIHTLFDYHCHGAEAAGTPYNDITGTQLRGCPFHAGFGNHHSCRLLNDPVSGEVSGLP